ncbi:MAG: DUF4139 domain-containing protein [Desulfovibrionaceae bacterium]
MKIFYVMLITCCIGTSFAHPAVAQSKKSPKTDSLPVQSPTRPESVLLHQNAATITTRQIVTIQNGQFTLILPSSVLEENITVLSTNMPVTSIVTNPSQIPITALPSIKQRLILKEKIARLDVRIAALESRIKLLSTSQQVFTSTKDLIDMDAALGKQFEILLSQKDTLTQQQKLLTTDLELLNKEIIASTGSTEPFFKTFTITLSNSALKGEKEILYSYITSGANWRPHYYVDADLKKGTVTSRLSAEIQQSTGFSWGAAPITLTTTPVTYGVLPPPLPKWNVTSSAEQKPQPRMASPMIQTLELAHSDAAADFSQEESPTAVTWSLGKQSIPLGKKEYLAINTFTWKADFLYTFRPYAESLAFLTAQLQSPNTKNLYLPGGRASYLVNGANVGFGHFQYSTSDDNTLYFGKDLLVKSTIKLVNNSLSATKSEQTKIWKWTLSLHNMRSTPIVVKVEDAFPVTQSPKIKLTLVDSYPKATVTPEQVEWNIPKIDSKASKVLEYEIKATAPIDIEIVSPR